MGKWVFVTCVEWYSKNRETRWWRTEIIYKFMLKLKFGVDISVQSKEIRVALRNIDTLQ